MSKDDTEFQRRLLSTFKLEAAEHIQALSTGLIELERDASPGKRMQIVETVFRGAHSLKGAARAVGAAQVEAICQALEGVFAALKREQSECAPALLDILHDAVDALSKLLLSIGAEPAAKDRALSADLLHRLDQALKGAGVASTRPLAQAGMAARLQQPREPHGTRPEDRAVLADTVRISTVRLDALLFRAEGLLAAKLTSAQRAAEIREAADQLSALAKERVKAAPGVKAVQRGLERAGKVNGRDRTDLEVRKLLELIARESALVRSVEARLGALVRSSEHDYRALGGMVDGLLDDMKKALMLPVSSVLEVFPKFLRDVARAQGKEVDLVTQGEDIEIDRRVLEAMRDPLIHLLRNCIDHGIETTEVRKLKGKPPRGTITVTVARKDGSRIEMLVADDGAGIDAAKVEDAAQKLGIVFQQGARGREEAQLVQLVFQSGVSTSPIVTDISGRGLGLAIVQEKVEGLGGAISVETQPGRGTSFRIALPLTLATFRGVHVRVGEHVFVLPTTHVEQVGRLKQEVIRTVENRETIEWGGRALALVRLADVLELPVRSPEGASGDTVQVIILGSMDKRIAFLVDEVLDEQEVLVKSLGKQLSRVRNIAGAAVLGTGQPVPILDVPDLLRSAIKAAAAPALTAIASGESSAERKSILVAEDSITSRALLKNILESAGYDVSTAVDGVDAISLLKTQHHDLVVSDVEMPRMNGFDLTARIRADKALVDLPVVLVTALESREDRERGIDVGANAYIVKSSFDRSNLLDVIRRLI